MSGNFYAIYNEDAAELTPGSAVADRLKRKKDEDIGRIYERMDSVSIERAYRIIKTLEDRAESLKTKVPRLQEAYQTLSRNLLWTDLIVIGGIAATIGALSFSSPLLQTSFSSLYSTTAGATLTSTFILILIILTHFKLRGFLARMMAKRWMKKDVDIARSLMLYSKGWKSLLRVILPAWSKRKVKILSALVTESKRSIQKLNDQFVSPSGLKEES